MSVDVLIIAALREELEPLLLVSEGVVDGWREDGPLFRAVLAGAHGHIEVAAAWLAKTGGIETAADASTLVAQLDAKCLAMCGVCGGHPSDTEYGDVVIADRVTQHDEGKRGAEGFKRDLWVHAMDEDWRREALVRADKPAAGLWGYREPDVETSRWWMLERIAAGENIQKCKATGRYLPGTRYRELATELEKTLKYIKGKGQRFELTSKGRKALDEHRRMRLPWVESLPYHTQVGVIVSGNAVEADGTIWRRMADGGARKVVAVEMEAFAIGHIAHKRGIPFVVCKGVMDHADPNKGDNYKPFAARASAEVLCSFLRAVCRPARAGAVQLEGSRPAPQSPAGDSDSQLTVDLDEVRIAICAQLERDADTRAVLAKAFATSDPEQLARVMVNSDDVLALVEVFLAALQQLQPSRPEHKRVAGSLRAIFDVVVPAIAGPHTRLGLGSGGRQETNARHVRALDVVMAARRGDKKLVFHQLPGQRATPRHGYDLAHPEAGMDDREHVLVIGSDLAKRFGEPLADRIAKMCRGLVGHRVVEAGVLAYRDIDERLLNVANALRARPDFYVLAIEEEHDLAAVIREYLPLSVIFSVKDDTWQYHTNLGWRICDVYDQYFRINPEDASR